MPKSKNVEETVRRFAEPAVKELGYRLWDVEYESHGGYSELTLYIDRPDGGAIGTDDCERVSHAVDPLMDRYDPIEEAYTSACPAAAASARCAGPSSSRPISDSPWKCGCTRRKTASRP